MGMTRVVVRIERLVLHGVARGDEHRLAEALRGELARQLAHATPHALSVWHAASHIDAGSVPVGSSVPEQLGASAGRAIAGRLAAR
jgi:hypothetical protein